MLRVKIKSDFFSCDVKMDNKSALPFLKDVHDAFMNYKKFGNTIYWRYSDRRREKIQDDILTVKISQC
jgi:hypothetical protein